MIRPRLCRPNTSIGIYLDARAIRLIATATLCATLLLGCGREPASGVGVDAGADGGGEVGVNAGAGAGVNAGEALPTAGRSRSAAAGPVGPLEDGLEGSAEGEGDDRYGTGPGAATTPPPSHTVLTPTPPSAGSIWDLEVELTDHLGTTRPLSEFTGTPTIISMFYARCSYACPTLIQDIQNLERLLDASARDRVKVLLVTFDRDNDDTAALAELAKRFDTDRRWTFARAASDDDTLELAAALGIKFRRLPDGHYNHSTLITLLDFQGIPLARIDGLRQDSTAFRAVVDVAISQLPNKQPDL